MAIDLES